MQKHKTSDVVFSCSKLNKEFLTRGKKITALQDLTFSVSQGEFICVVGPSGCGKSTLLRIIAELIPMTSGGIEFRQTDTTRPRTAMVFQGQGLFPWMNVIDNTAFGLAMQGVDKKNRHEQA